MLTLVVAIVAFVRWWRDRSGTRSTDATAFVAFALVLRAKMLLNARLVHYGFALTMLATALIVVALAEWFPTALARFRIDAAAVRAGVVALLIGFAFVHLEVSAKTLARKDFVIGQDGDRFRTDVRGRVVDAALTWLRARSAGKRPTLAVLPEGMTINYLARLDAPTPYINLVPPELLLLGEANIVASFVAELPDVVLLVHKSTAAYGLPWFGRDYARDLSKWIAGNYCTAALFGDPPLQPGSAFGIAVLVRR